MPLYNLGTEIPATPFIVGLVACPGLFPGKFDRYIVEISDCILIYRQPQLLRILDHNVLPAPILSVVVHRRHPALCRLGLEVSIVVCCPLISTMSCNPLSSDLLPETCAFPLLQG
ncbi:hypothetical protein D6C00_12930 [Thiohalobacter thiocyanaticus]|uniref:Uncharacterized protein n=1 Tax=Thiohalobacter thiocyanaticus TaxID=585455 RepID=A0A426QLV1_9GAMM|nr:hypothetical protein D6C00_12930 [Thiohalobacter thiocyanaticus]